MPYDPTRRLTLHNLVFPFLYLGQRDHKRIVEVGDHVSWLMAAALRAEPLTNRLRAVEIALVAGEKDESTVEFLKRGSGDIARVTISRPIPPHSDAPTIDLSTVEFVTSLFETAIRAVGYELSDPSFFPCDHYSKRLEELKPRIEALAGASSFDAKAKIRAMTRALPKPSNDLILKRLGRMDGSPRTTYVQGVRVVHDFQRPKLFPYNAICELLYTSALSSIPLPAPGYSEIVVSFADTLYDAVCVATTDEWGRVAPAILDVAAFEASAPEDRLSFLVSEVGRVLSELSRRDGLPARTLNELHDWVLAHEIHPFVVSIADQFLTPEGIEPLSTSELIKRLEHPRIAQKWRPALLGMPRFVVKKVA
jgi:hypothetical protein